MLVTGGEESAGKSVELLSSNGTRLCSLPDLPGERWGHSQTGIVTCGGGVGSEETSCVTFEAGSWKKTHTLGREWLAHTAWASPRGVMLMKGARRRNLNFRSVSKSRETRTELLTDNGGSTQSFTMAYFARYIWHLDSKTPNQLGKIG